MKLKDDFTSDIKISQIPWFVFNLPSVNLPIGKNSDLESKTTIYKINKACLKA